MRACLQLRIGVNEFLCKPISAKALLERLISILAKPWANVQVGEYYGPGPRKLMAPGDPGVAEGQEEFRDNPPVLAELSTTADSTFAVEPQDLPR